MNEIIEKYFKFENIIYYHPADIIADDHYLKYITDGNKVILIIGCGNGEVPFKLYNKHSEKELEEDIKRIIF